MKYPRTQNFVVFILALRRRIMANLLYTHYVYFGTEVSYEKSIYYSDRVFFNF
jgi:hypothetical protein